jgi:hypothetical protein
MLERMDINELAAKPIHRPPYAGAACTAGGCTAEAVGTAMPVEPKLCPPGVTYGTLGGLRPYCDSHLAA